jgi:hypothetical protein
MPTRIRIQFVALLLVVAGLTLAMRFTDENPTPPSMDGGLPVAEFGLDPDAPRPELLSPEDQQIAIEQALTNMWEWMPDYERHRPEARTVDAVNGMIAFRKLPEDLFYFTNPEGNVSYALATNLPTVHHFEWSPDEKHVAFISQDESGSACVHRANVETREHATVVCGFAAAYEPRWSPDGARLTFYGQQTADENIRAWFVPSTGGRPIELAADLSIAYTPSWLDSDTVLLSGRVDSKAWGIYRVDIDQPNSFKAITPLFNPSYCEGTFAIYPEINVSGNLVAFAAARSSGSSKSSVCYASVYTVDPDGTTAPALKGDIASTAQTNHGRYGRLRWHPDDKQVGIMGSGDNNVLRLYVVDTGNGQIKELHGQQGGSFSVWEWSPDGTQMAGGHAPDGGAWTLYRIDPFANPDTFTPIGAGNDPAWSSRPVDPPVDLEATGLEITQAIQDGGNTIPLVANKLTWVRLYVRSVSGDERSATARLIVSQNGTDTTIRPVNQRVQVIAGGSQRANVGTTFNFLLPLALSHGEIALRAEVAPGQEFRETNYDNNVFPRASAPAQAMLFHETSTINIYSYRFRFVMPDGVEHVASADDAQALMGYMRAAYPVSEDGLPRLIDGGEIVVNADDYDMSQESSWIALIRLLPCQVDAHDRCFGWLPSAIQPSSNPFWGYAIRPSAIAAASYPNRDLSSLIAHELGHTFSLGHSGCGRIEEFGLRGTRESQTLYAPTSTYNFMNPTSACGMLGPNQWISVANYRALFNRLSASDTRRGDSTAPYLVVSGFLQPGGDGQLDPAYELSQIAGQHDSQGEGPYRLELLGQGGELLFTRYFAGGVVEGDDPSEVVSFIEMMPRPANLARIALWDGENKVDELLLTANTPNVQLSTSLAGHTMDGLTEVTWTASDADGDSLRYAIEYSPDGGSLWQIVAAQLTDTVYTIDPAYLPGTTQGKLRVRASDGLQTAESVSDGFFTVPSHAPTVQILSPQPGYQANWLHVDLVGSAYDREDGPLPEAAFAWSVDGMPAGQGSVVSIDPLGNGAHVISLTVTDSSGQIATAEVTVTMTALPTRLYLPTTLYGEGSK